jgi:hypothetical protein
MLTFSSAVAFSSIEDLTKFFVRWLHFFWILRKVVWANLLKYLMRNALTSFFGLCFEFSVSVRVLIYHESKNECSRMILIFKLRYD